MGIEFCWRALLARRSASGLPSSGVSASEIGSYFFGDAVVEIA